MSDAATSGPTRTCVGCRARCPVDELLRVVAVAGALVPDERRRRPGRGAYVHPQPRCIQQAVRRRAFARALRTSVTDVAALDAALAGSPADRGS